MACGMGGATYAVRVFSWNDHSDHMADKKVELKAERRAEALERRERRAARNAAAQSVAENRARRDFADVSVRKKFCCVYPGKKNLPNNVDTDMAV